MCTGNGSVVKKNVTDFLTLKCNITVNIAFALC